MGQSFESACLFGPLAGVAACLPARLPGVHDAREAKGVVAAVGLTARLAFVAATPKTARVWALWPHLSGCRRSTLLECLEIFLWQPT